MTAILQVTPALNAGGVERTTLEIAAALARAGKTALVASAGGRLEGDLQAAGGELLRLPLDTKNPLTIWTNAARLVDAARARAVRLIHARSRAPGWSAYWAARRLELPFVTTYHGIYSAGFPLKRAYNAVMAKGDIVIANSKFTRAHVIVEHGLDPERVVAIPRGVDLAAFDPAAIGEARVQELRASWRAHGLIVLLPARLTRWKGQTLAIEAAARILRRRPGALTLVLAGDSQGRDAYVAELESRIAELGMQQDIILAGHVADMPAALKAAHIVLAPSVGRAEAFGRSAAEAQAMGLPVIAADLGGFTETIASGETGYLTPPGDVEALQAAMERMLDMGEDGRARMGAAAMARARRLYAVSALQEATLAVYDRLLGEQKR